MAERGYELGVKTRIEVEDAAQNLRAAEANLGFGHAFSPSEARFTRMLTS